MAQTSFWKGITVKCPKDKDIKCKCGGDVFVDGTGSRQIPIGFGGHGDGKFHVDSVRYKGYFGECEKCHKNVFAWYKKSTVSKVLAFGRA